MKSGVEDEEVVGADAGCPHPFDQRIGPVEFRRVQHGVTGRPSFQKHASLDDIRCREMVGRQMQSQRRPERHARFGDHDSAGGGSGSDTGTDDTHRLEYLDRLTHRGPRDAEIRGERPLGRQSIAENEAVCRQLGLDPAQHELVRSHPRSVTQPAIT